MRYEDEVKADKDHKEWVAISVVGRDRPGIVAGVSEVLFHSAYNIEALTQTAIMGQFAMILIASRSGIETVTTLKDDLDGLAKDLGLEIHLRKLGSEDLVPYRHGETEPFVITVHGEDRPGLVYGIAGILAEHGINITNLDAKVAFVSQRLEYIQVFLVDIPKDVDSVLLQERLRDRGKEMGVTVDLQHRQIFQAINQL